MVGPAINQSYEQLGEHTLVYLYGHSEIDSYTRSCVFEYVSMSLSDDWNWNFLMIRSFSTQSNT